MDSHQADSHQAAWLLEDLIPLGLILGDSVQLGWPQTASLPVDSLLVD